MALILSAGTASPNRVYTQDEVRRHCEKALAGTPAGRRLDIIGRAGVETRRLVETPDYYFADHPFEKRNGDWLRHGRELSCRALEAALAEAGLSHGDVSHLIFATTTGLLTPSLDARLAQELPFPRSLKRTPLFGAGCAGGAVALARAFEYLRGAPRETVAVLSVELCSLTFLPKDGTMTQLVAAALFGDGAACVLLCGPDSPHAGRARLAVIDVESALIPDSLHVMGWEFGGDGMRLVLSSDAPAVVERSVGGALAPLLARHALGAADLGELLLHPGSGRILDACERGLGLPPGSTEPSRAFLRRHGNLSSASVLFILRDALPATRPPGTWGLLAAMGPGFACEALLLRRP